MCVYLHTRGEALGILGHKAALQQSRLKQHVAQLGGGLLHVIRLGHTLLEATDQRVPVGGLSLVNLRVHHNMSIYEHCVVVLRWASLVQQPNTFDALRAGHQLN